MPVSWRRPVAVKVIRPGLAADREFRARFRREVEAARKVSGLFTALLVDADLDGPVPWLATAYVPGPSLADAVTDHGPLPAASVLTLAAGLAESLAAIHTAGVVHRDLKPSNVLLADDGPRVIDFGISLAAEASALTGTGLVIGSPGFMSPEQAEGGQVGPPSDMFSLGAVLTYAVTGHGPFGAGSTAALIYRVVHGAPDLESISAELRPQIERCLAKEPGGRPTAPDLLAEFGDVDVTAGWIAAPMTTEVPESAGPGPAAHSRTVREPGRYQPVPAPRVSRAGAGAPPTITQMREPAFSAVLRPPSGHGGQGTPPRHPAPAAALAGPTSTAAYAVAFSPDGNSLAVADACGQIYQWDLASGGLARTFVNPRSRGVLGADFCPDGELLAAADANGRVYLWDTTDGSLARIFTRRPSHSMNDVAFGLGGDVLAAASDNGKIYLWDVVSGESAGVIADPDSKGVLGVAFDRDTELLAAADACGQVYLWEIITSGLTRPFNAPGSQGVNDVTFSPQGDTLAAADASGKACIWDVPSGQLARTLTAPGTTALYTVAFAPNGGLLAAGDANGQIYLWDVADGELTGTFADPSSQGVNDLAFSPQGDTLAAADGNGHAYLWKTSTQARQ